ncbi:glycosyltransferase family 4 protein [Acinetobacter towneri]|uniref:glycosyltransferase family 4 protein n=1 Tax=Acinetobacter towneri TaxID=202956 RepID=UPI002578BF37|nr:glycosyltransferase family 4 protein [Acinetobacter towneri]MDM1722265.1 glycosyltransferase family 4 protein [Acinetobacter towneri]
MKILQVTNIVSHHQLPLARELYNLVGEDNFLFVATEALDQERLKNGWQGEYTEKWIINPNNSIEEKEKFDKFWDEADVVLCGVRLISRMQQRVDNKKLCFYMSERWWKPPVGILRLCHPEYLKMVLNFRRLSKSPYFHYLPTGPFAAKDMALVTSMSERVWQWGYFTEIPNLTHNISEVVNSKTVSVLWVGRMLKWKNVDLLIKVLARLKNEGKDFKLTLVGDGPERERLQKLADKLLGDQYYTIQNFIPAAEVPILMAKHEIYVLPSNAYEGWGAVINEAMSVGCAVVASDKTGAGAAMIEHGLNGMLFKSGSVDSLYECLNELINIKSLRDDLGMRARSTFIEHWNPRVVAQRFINLSSDLMNCREVVDCSHGPLSKINK